MNRAVLLGATSLIAAFTMLGASFDAGRPNISSANAAEAVAAATTTPVERAEIEKIVREYLVSNPEILMEMQQALEIKQQEEQRLAHLEVIKGAKEAIFNASYDGFVGNPDGKTVIVEFYDYNCGYCKRAQEDMLTLTESDPDLRFVLKEFPILGPDSQKASIVSMAFRTLMPERHGEFHNLLIGGQGRASEDAAIKIALQLGVDEDSLRKEMKNPAITAAFAETYDLANKLQITGTPSYVVGNEVVFGALGPEVLGQKIAEARACMANATC